jgi:hypothetical protein
VGNCAVRRGELQPVLRASGPIDAAAVRGVRALRHQHKGRDCVRAQVGESTHASTSPRSPTSPTASAGWSRSTRTTRLHAPQAHGARPVQARGRDHRRRARRPGRRLHG